MLSINRRTFILFVAVCLGHALLISSQVQTKTGVPVAESMAFSAFASVQRVATSFSDFWRGFWGNHVVGRGVERDNAALRQRIAELEAQVQQQQAAASEVAALESALALRQQVATRTLAARVIAGDPSPSSITPTITIDRGSDDGVTADMAVISAQGVVGRVIGKPTAHAAQVQLLIGRNAAAGALLERTQTLGIVEGGADDPPLLMNYVSNSADVKVGDRVVTSGEDGIFPRGYFIGTIARAERGNGQSRVLAVDPAVYFSHLDIVLVILTSPAQPGGAAK